MASVANMTAPIPEEQDQPPIEADDPPGEHAGELPGELPGEPAAAADDAGGRAQAENAETSLDEPSDGSGGE